MPGGRAKRGRAQAADPTAAGVHGDAHDDAPASGMTALHRWRSPPWRVAAATALAACPDGSAVAAAYEDGRVEVWHLSYLCRLMAVPGWEGADLSSLAWAHDAFARRWRLFAASLDGAIYEVDFERQQLAHASDSYGGAVWALAAAPGGGGGKGDGGGGDSHDLVAACDDGSLRLLRVNAGAAGCEYVRMLAKAEGRALAVAWHPDGKAVVGGGSDGCIHAYDVASGRELMRITAAVHAAAPPCIWSLAVLPDGTIVSGGSDGATQFWEGRFGTLISRLQQHAADVLAVAASVDGSLVYSAGVDPRVAVFKRVPDAGSGAERWAYLAHKSPHSHEVRALAAAPRGAGADELLLSGGVDGQLVLYPALKILQEHPVRLTKAPQAPLLQLAPRVPGGAPRLVVAQGRTLSLWRLGRAAPARAAPAAASGDAGAAAQSRPDLAVPDHEQEGDPLDLSEAPGCLAELRLRGPRHVACAAVAAGGGRVAVSDASGVRLFSIEEEGSGGGGPVVVRRVTRNAGAGSGRQQQQQQQQRDDADGDGDGEEDEEDEAPPPPPAVCMAFAADGAAVFCADAEGTVRRVDAVTGRVVASLRLDATADSAAPLGAAAAATRRAGAGSSSSSSSSSSDSDSSDDSSSDGSDDEAGAPNRRARRRGRRAARAARSAAAAAQPPVSALAASPDGRWLAAACGAGVRLVELLPGGGLAPAGPLLLLGDAGAADAAPVTAIAFSPDSAAVAVATAADLLAAYSVATRAPTPWSADHWAPLSKLLALLPGTIEGLSFEPAPAGAAAAAAGDGAAAPGAAAPLSLLVRSAGGICHVDMAAPLSADALSGKRRRGPAKPRPGERASAAGLNGRVLPLDSPCLFLGYTGLRAALLVERPWEEVLAALPPPLLRHKYGT